MDFKGHGRSPRTKGQNFATPDKSLQYKKHRGEGEPPKGTTELIKLHQWQSLLMWRQRKMQLMVEFSHIQSWKTAAKCLNKEIEANLLNHFKSFNITLLRLKNLCYNILPLLFCWRLSFRFLKQNNRCYKSQIEALNGTWCNVKFSFCFTSKYKAIWKDNLVVNQASLRAFYHRPLQLKASNTVHFSISVFLMISALTTVFFVSRLFKSKRLWKHFQDFRQSYWWHTIYGDVSFYREWNSKYRANFSKVKSFFELTLANCLFVCA